MIEARIHEKSKRAALPFLEALRASCISLVVLGAQSASAYQETCDSAAKFAGREFGVPLDVLLAITRLETGRHSGNVLQPWPWTVNVTGDGYWFSSLDEALAFTFGKYKSGIRSFDVGCFQLNYKWHGHEFSSIRDMFDPKKNAMYAAKFLSTLHDEFGDWELAAGAYHSRTKRYSDRYKARFRETRAMQEVDSPQNSWGGFLQGRAESLVPDSGARQSLGSLVALANSNNSIIDLN